MRDLRPDVAIVAAAGRGNIDGEPIQGSLAQFVAREVELLGADRVVLSHHDNWLPGFSVDTDLDPDPRRARRVSSPRRSCSSSAISTARRSFRDVTVARGRTIAKVSGQQVWFAVHAADFVPRNEVGSIDLAVDERVRTVVGRDEDPTHDPDIVVLVRPAAELIQCSVDAGFFRELAAGAVDPILSWLKHAAERQIPVARPDVLPTGAAVHDDVAGRCQHQYADGAMTKVASPHLRSGRGPDDLAGPVDDLYQVGHRHQSIVAREGLALSPCPYRSACGRSC